MVLYLKNHQELSPGIIQKKSSSGSVAHQKNVVLYLNNYEELSPCIMQKRLRRASVAHLKKLV